MPTRLVSLATQTSEDARGGEATFVLWLAGMEDVDVTTPVPESRNIAMEFLQRY